MPRIRIHVPLPTYDELEPRLKAVVQEGMKRNHLDHKFEENAPNIVITHMSAHGSKALTYVQSYLDTPREDSVMRFEAKDMMLGAYRRTLEHLKAMGLEEEFHDPDRLDAAARTAQEFLAAQNRQLDKYAAESAAGGVLCSDPACVKPYVTKAGHEIDADTLVRYFTDEIAKGVFEEAFRAFSIPEREWVGASEKQAHWTSKRSRRGVDPEGGGTNGHTRSRAG